MSFFRTGQRDLAAVEAVPQRLKPIGGKGVFGTAEAVSPRIFSSLGLQIPSGLPYRLFPAGALRVVPALMVMLCLGLSGCGYHQAGAATHLPPNVQSLAVPLFQSKVQGFRVESVFTEAVVRELNARTRYRVMTASDAADATLRGTILTETTAPLTYDASSGQTSSYLVSVTAQVVLTTHDGTVLYRNDAFAWHEQFQSTQDLNGSVQEDSAAVRRMAHDFGEALVSDMLESFR